MANEPDNADCTILTVPDAAERMKQAILVELGDFPGAELAPAAAIDTVISGLALAVITRLARDGVFLTLAAPVPVLTFAEDPPER